MTSIQQRLEALGLTKSAFFRKTNLDPSNGYRLLAGTLKAGARVRARVSAALQTSETEIFDDRGWPIVLVAQ